MGRDCRLHLGLPKLNSERVKLYTENIFETVDFSVETGEKIAWTLSLLRQCSSSQ